jgi:hypothetical protein
MPFFRVPVAAFELGFLGVTPGLISVGIMFFLFRVRVHEAIGPGLLHEGTAIAFLATAVAVTSFNFLY